MAALAVLSWSALIPMSVVYARVWTLPNAGFGGYIIGVGCQDPQRAPVTARPGRSGRRAAALDGPRPHGRRATGPSYPGPPDR